MKNREEFIMSDKKLYRSRANRMVCGVCGGIGEYFNVDPTLIRLGAAILTVCSVGTGLILDFVAAVIIPEG